MAGSSIRLSLSDILLSDLASEDVSVLLTTVEDDDMVDDD